MKLQNTLSTHRRIHKSPSLVPLLSHLNPPCNPILVFFRPSLIFYRIYVMAGHVSRQGYCSHHDSSRVRATSVPAVSCAGITRHEIIGQVGF